MGQSSSSLWDYVHEFKKIYPMQQFLLIYWSRYISFKMQQWREHNIRRQRSWRWLSKHKTQQWRENNRGRQRNWRWLIKWRPKYQYLMVLVIKWSRNPGKHVWWLRMNYAICYFILFLVSKFLLVIISDNVKMVLLKIFCWWTRF